MTLEWLRQPSPWMIFASIESKAFDAGSLQIPTRKKGRKLIWNENEFPILVRVVIFFSLHTLTRIDCEPLANYSRSQVTRNFHGDWPALKWYWIRKTYVHTPQLIMSSRGRKQGGKKVFRSPRVVFDSSNRNAEHENNIPDSAKWILYNNILMKQIPTPPYLRDGLKVHPGDDT